MAEQEQEEQDDERDHAAAELGVPGQPVGGGRGVRVRGPVHGRPAEGHPRGGHRVHGQGDARRPARAHAQRFKRHTG